MMIEEELEPLFVGTAQLADSSLSARQLYGRMDL